MPAQSQQQQKLFGLALSVKRGETPRSEASEDVLGIVDSMTEKEIEDFAGTSHKGLPKKVEEMIRGMVRENLKETLSEANPRLNKKVKSYLDNYLSGVKKNSPEHQHALMLIMRGALTDANFHSEAKQLGKYFPKASQHKVSSQMEDVIESKGEDIASWAKWDGYDIIDAFAFYTSMTIGGSFGAKFQSLKEGITNEINEMNEAGISRMYMVFLGAQKKVRELEDEQKKMLAQWKAEKDPKKKAKIFDKMKKGTVTLKKRRANLSDIERDYINNMAYDTSYSESVNERLNTRDMKYMDGLALRKPLDIALKELRKVGQDLIDSEGFEKSDVKEFLLSKVSRILHVGLRESVEESLNEGKHDEMLDKLAGIVKGVKFMNIGKELKKNGIRYSFSTSMIPMYKIDKFPIAIVNKKYAAGAEREVGDTAIGLLEAIIEQNEK